MNYNDIILELFTNNKQDLTYIKSDVDSFNINYYYLYEDYKSKNKLDLIIKSLAVLLNNKVEYTFETPQILKISIRNQNTTFMFDNFIFDVPLTDGNYNILLGVDPNGNTYYEKLTNIKSLLIGGSSGSGKSNVLHQIILSYIFNSKTKYLYLIDMKANELVRYNYLTKSKILPRPVAYDFESALKIIVIFKNLIKKRYKQMQRQKLRTSNEPPVVLVIDEYAQLFTNSKQKKIINELISSCAALGRAANCFLILATQHPTNENLTASIRANMQSRIVLKCMTPQQSSNLLGSTEATSLQFPGDSIIHIDGKRPVKVKTTFVSDEVLHEIETTGGLDRL